MFSQYKIFLHFHTIFLQTKEITGELNRDVPGGPGTHVRRPPRADAVVEPVLALAACRMTRTSQDVNGKIFLQNRGETWRGGSLRAEEDEEDGDGGPPEGVRDLSSSHSRIGRGYVFILLCSPREPTRPALPQESWLGLSSYLPPCACALTL